MDSKAQEQIDTAIEIARRIIESYLVAVDQQGHKDSSAVVTITASYSHYSHAVSLGVNYAETVE